MSEDRYCRCAVPKLQDKHCLNCGKFVYDWYFLTEVKRAEVAS